MGNFNLHLQPVAVAGHVMRGSASAVADGDSRTLAVSLRRPARSVRPGRRVLLGQDTSLLVGGGACRMPRAATSIQPLGHSSRWPPDSSSDTAPAISGVFSNRALAYHDTRGVMNAFPAARRRKLRDERGATGRRRASHRQ